MNLRNQEGQTAIDVAQENGYDEAVELLTRQNRLRRLLSPNMSASRRRQLDEEDVPDDQKCVICYQRRKEVICAPCGHKALCRVCTKALLTRPEAERNCPVCREKVRNW